MSISPALYGAALDKHFAKLKVIHEFVDAIFCSASSTQDTASSLPHWGAQLIKEHSQNYPELYAKLYIDDLELHTQTDRAPITAMFDIFLNAYNKKEQPLIQLYWLSQITQKNLLVLETPLAQANVIKIFEEYLFFENDINRYHRDRSCQIGTRIITARSIHLIPNNTVSVNTFLKIPLNLNAAQKNAYLKLVKNIQIQYINIFSKYS